MSNDSKEPLKGKELRDLARSEPSQAFIYLENNKTYGFKLLKPTRLTLLIL